MGTIAFSLSLSHLLSLSRYLVRFHVCAQSLPFSQTVAKNPVYFLQMIWDMAQYTNQLIRRSNKGNIFASYKNIIVDNIKFPCIISYLLLSSLYLQG